MAIRAECGECGRVYNVKDELDGKKIRCKECQAVVLVQSESEDDWDESVDEEEFQPPIRKSNAKKGTRKSRGSGMPVPIIVALVCIAMMMGVTIFEIISVALSEVGVQAKGGKAVVYILRAAIQIAIFRGVWKGTASTVTPSIIMAVITTLMISAVAVLSAFIPGGALIVISLVFFALVRVVYIGCMLTPSARGYMRN
ncbi:MAG: hypothetical protein U0929_03040 [Planctomycetaceae bacterium]